MTTSKTAAGSASYEEATMRDAATVEQVPEGWDRSAGFYDAYVASFTAKYARDALDLTGVKAGHRVLDVAAGTGALALAAAQRGASVLATDFSRGMVDWMRAKASHLALTSFEVAEMDGQHLDVPDASFDRAFSVFGLMFFPDRKKGFSELRRVLKPDGSAAVVTWSTPAKMTVLSAFMDTLWRVLPDSALPPRPPPWLALSEPDGLRREMKAGGFSHVRVHTVSHVLVFDDPNTAFDWLTGATPALNVLVGALPEEDRAAFRRGFSDDVIATQGGGPFGFEAEAHIGIGRP
jgi:ubiquinone/menaquinone biosynthesis C-methylase UbiE